MGYQEALKVYALTEQAIFEVKYAAEEERKITHAKHISEHYRNILDRLDIKITGERALLARYKALEN